MKLNMAGFFVSACLLCSPLLAQAHHLAISNHTTFPLTFSVNNVCSKDFGTIDEYEIKTISEEMLNKACANYNAPCEIIGYDGKNCTGKSIGGIRYLSEHSFEISWGESNVSIGASEDSLFYTEPMARK